MSSRLTYSRCGQLSVTKYTDDRTDGKVSPAEAVRRNWATQQAFDDLVRGYYRFAEGSINMVAPSLLFGILLPLYAQARLSDVGQGYLLATGAAGVLSAAALVATGFYTYREYRHRVNDLCSPPLASAKPGQ